MLNFLNPLGILSAIWGWILAIIGASLDPSNFVQYGEE